MSAPEEASGLIITRCEQSGVEVHVYGRFAPEGAERERFLYARPGYLREFSGEKVVIESYEGAPEEWSPQGDRLDPDGDLIESLRKGNTKTITEVFFVILVLLIALATGALDI